MIYKLFGHNLDAVYLIQILLALSGYYALYRAGKILGGEKLGLVAAALSSLYGVFIFYDVQIQKESLAVMVTCFFLWLLLEAHRRANLRLWLWAGIFCGLLILLRENTFLAVPFLLPLTYKHNQLFRLCLQKAGLFLLGAILILFPVALRNGIVGGSFLPTTFQGGVNFYIGNNPAASGTYQPIVAGKEIPYYERTEPIRIAEEESGRKLSPAEVSLFWLKKSWAWIKQHPLDWLRLQLKKILMFWSFYEWPDAVDYYYVKKTSPALGLPLIEFGSLCLLALIGFSAGFAFFRQILRNFTPVILFLLGWMFSTVVFFLFSRYRLPAIPGLIPFAALPFVFISEFWKRRKYKEAGILLSLVVLALLLPLSRKHEPRMDLVHYNIGVIYHRQGDLESAASHFRHALEANPDDFLSCLNLGNIAFQQNAWEEAIEWYRKAESLEPNSEGIQVNLGSAYAALGRHNEAEFHLKKALKINPQNIEALHNMSVLEAKRGNFEEALKWNEKVLELVPHWQPARQFKKKIEGIKLKN